jgi:hypothetical protein
MLAKSTLDRVEKNPKAMREVLGTVKKLPDWEE